jgi:hypothetical protein
MDGPAPAVVNAIVDALGVPFDSIPLMPEDIFHALEDEAARENQVSPPRAAQGQR